VTRAFCPDFPSSRIADHFFSKIFDGFSLRLYSCRSQLLIRAFFRAFFLLSIYFEKKYDEKFFSKIKSDIFEDIFRNG